MGRICLSIIHGLSLGSPRVIRKLDTKREFENVWIYLWRGPVWRFGNGNMAWLPPSLRGSTRMMF